MYKATYLLFPGSSSVRFSQRNTKLKRFGITAATAIGCMGAGGRYGRRHGNVEERCETTYGSPEKQKISCLKGYLAAIKRLML